MPPEEEPHVESVPPWLRRWALGIVLIAGGLIAWHLALEAFSDWVYWSLRETMD